MHNLSNEYNQNGHQESAEEFELNPQFETDEMEMESDELGYELLPEFENDEFESSDEVLIQELMEITNEAEFFGWLKKAAKKVGGVASKFLNSPLGQQATSALGSIARKTLPNLAGKAAGWLGGKIGGVVGQQATGQRWGQQLGAKAGNAAADRFPQFAKFATDAITNLSNEFEEGTLTSVKPAIIRSASKHYPMILKVKGTLVGRRVQGNRASNVSNEFENYESDGEADNQEGTFNEMTEMELASELLNIQSEAELDQFLGKLFKKAVRGVSNFAKSGAGRALGGMLKGIAKKALPIAGGAIGSFIAPGIGTSIGSSLGSALGNVFELELEGLSAEDREFELSRAFVRFSGNAARRAARMRNMKPQRAARTSIVRAARRYAPGLLIRRPRYYYGSAGGYQPPVYQQPVYTEPAPPEETYDDVPEGDEPTGESGSWHKQGNRIVLTGNF